MSLASRFFAGNDVVNVADRESLYYNMTAARVLKTFDPIRCKYQIQVERAVLQLYKILPSLNL